MAGTGPAGAAWADPATRELLADLDPRIPALAQEITAHAGGLPDRKARARAPGLPALAALPVRPRRGSPQSDYALADFLFPSHRGYCEQYAAAIPVLARAVGIPSRVAVGFVTGSRGTGGAYEVTVKQRHAWPELWITGSGWCRTSRRQTAGADSSASRDLVVVTGVVGGLLVAAVLVSVAVRARRRRRRGRLPARAPWGWTRTGGWPGSGLGRAGGRHPPVGLGAPGRHAALVDCPCGAADRGAGRGGPEPLPAGLRACGLRPSGSYRGRVPGRVRGG